MAKDCCFGNLPPWGEAQGRAAQGLGERLLFRKPSPVGGRWLHEVQPDEGLGGFLFAARLKSSSSATPSSVAKGDSFPPRGKLKGAQPESSAKDCYLGNLPPTARIFPRVVVERKRNGRSTFVARVCSFRRSFLLTPTGGSSRARDPAPLCNLIISSLNICVKKAAVCCARFELFLKFLCLPATVRPKLLPFRQSAARVNLWTALPAGKSSRASAF